YMGRIASGRVRVGEKVLIQPGGRRTEVTGIVTFDGDREDAFAPQSVTLTLAEDLDVSRGDIISGVENFPEPRSSVTATPCWLSRETMKIGAKYLLRHTSRRVKAMVTGIHYKVDPNTLDRAAGITELKQNDIASVTVKTLQPIACDAYKTNRDTGAFIL